ncbi:MAG: hypothetical protein QM582_06515 [Micropruina sp.]|uniref:hypothetical protein n=1 Tax=Micropruina sp. TaxID=2737536 RepID=UPI0039E24CA0
MRNAYGRALRAKVVAGFSVDDVIVMHDADAFESEVSAYPAITVISKRSQGTATIAKAGEGFRASQTSAYLRWRDSAEPRLTTADLEATVLPSWHETSDVWPDGSPAVIAWLERLEETMPLLEDASTGTRLGIGIATGADRIYIRSGPVDVEPDRLMPMVTPDAIRHGEFRFTGEHLISPWTADGLVQLSDYPKLARYYEREAHQLRSRSVAKRSGPHWYRTIDRQNFSLLQREMLVMQDMKAEATPVRVPAGYVPHHNLYWIVSNTWDLDALGGLLLSKVVEKQVEAYCVKMRGGTLRFQAQVLRKVRIPHIHDIDSSVLADLATAFRPVIGIGQRVPPCVHSRWIRFHADESATAHASGGRSAGGLRGRPGTDPRRGRVLVPRQGGPVDARADRGSRPGRPARHSGQREAPGRLQHARGRRVGTRGIFGAPDPVFDGTSYLDRMGIICERIRDFGLYDLTWAIAATSDPIDFYEPNPHVGWERFATDLTESFE